jgi:putative ABC transport system permease protein
LAPPLSEPLKARALMRPYALLYFYRRRLRVHAVQELLAGLGVAIAVALVLATTIASHSVTGSAGEVVHAVVGPASLQIRARDADGFPEKLLHRVERLPGVKQAAPLLEQTATIRSARGKSVTVDLAGADTSLVVLDGLAHTLPIAALSPGGIGLSRTTAQRLGVADAAAGSLAANGEAAMTLELRGRATPIRVSAVLGPEAFGALAQAQVAVMPLAQLQQIAGLQGQDSRILVQVRPGREAAVRTELRTLAGGGLAVAGADQDVAALKQALRPSDQASEFFAAISALLGFLFAFNALLLTVPERRQSIAELRVTGTRRPAIVQMFAFQALCLGLGASLLGLLGGYLLSLGVFHESSRYLAEAFTLGTGTVIGVRALLLALLGGVLATCIASTIPLLDLRRGQALDAVYAQAEGAPGNALGARVQRRLAVAAAILLAATTAMFVLEPALALLACAVLALASVCIVPLVFVGVLRAARALAERYQRLTILSVALTSLRGTTLRSLALAATGAVALFGSVALGGARNDLLRGIHGFAHSYSADADIWVANPGDNQATSDFVDDGQAARIAGVPGVARVEKFQGSFLQLGNRRLWVIARPLGADRQVLESQISGGDAATAVTRLGATGRAPAQAGGWIAVSKQIAEERHVPLGGTLVLPTPSGNVRFRVAGTTTNLTWPPGVIFIGTGAYARLWGTSAPTALGVQLQPGANQVQASAAIVRALGPTSGLEVSTAGTREASIDALAGEGLGQLREISTLLLIAAILALAAAVTSALWQRRASLADLRLSGVRPPRLRRILLVEAALMLGAGGITGAVAGIYGQVIIDGYLETVTGFPVASVAASFRPLEVFALVLLAVLAIVSVPGWLASRVSPMVALNE